MRIACLFVLALAGSVAAQPKAKPTPKQLEEARAHFKAAEAAKAKGDFKTAAVEYLAAYERFEDPEFFFNVAEVYRLANDEQTALTYYTKYLELDPNGRGAATARTAVDALRRSIAAKEDAAKHAAEEAAKQQAAEAAQKQQADPARQTAPVAQAAPAPEPVDSAVPESPGRSMRIAGLATAGAGAVALGVGVVFGLKAQAISKEAAEWDQFDQQRFNEGKSAETTMFILTGVGGAAVVAGGVLYFLGYRAGKTTNADTVTFLPTLGAGHAGFAATGRF